MTSPFPALHVAANEDAEARIETARSRTQEAVAFLDELDALLGEVA
jgi:hypothetical protein